MHSRVSLTVVAVVAFLATGCSAIVPTPPPTPTPPAPSPTAAQAASAAPAAPPVFVDGMIKDINDTQVTLADGRSFNLTARTGFVRQVALTPADLKTGMYVGVTATRQTNSLLASVVDVFGQSGNGSQFPMGGGNIMTNGTIQSVQGNSFTVKFGDVTAPVTLAPDAKIYQDQSATKADAKPGLPTTVITSNGNALAIRVRPAS
jgi:hypothetical protein